MRAADNGAARWSIASDLSDEKNAKDFKEWISALPSMKSPPMMKDGSPPSLFAWFEENMVGKTYSFDIPGYGHREFPVKSGLIGKLV